MTIHNTIYKSEVETLRTKTEVEIQDELSVTCSRIIDSKLCTIMINNSETRGAVTIGQIGNISKIDDEMYKMLAESQTSGWFWAN